MSEPIHFNGRDYPSEEAMPPKVRIAYGEAMFQAGAAESAAADDDLAKADAQLAAAKPADQPDPKPAWRGSDGAGGVPVPVEFDSVTGLGPAVGVHLNSGLRIIPNLGTPRPSEVVIYRDGLAYRMGKDIHTWRWEEVAAIVSNVWYSSHTVLHEYSLVQSGGAKIILDDGTKDVEDAIAPIKKAVFGRLLPPLQRAYDSGQRLAFGPVTIHKPTGIEFDKNLYGWPAILDVKSERGRFTVTLRDGKKHELRVSAIPNIEMMAELIGLKYFETSYA